MALRCLGLTLLGGALALLPLTLHGGVFGPKGENPQEQQATVRKDRDAVLADLYASKPELKDRIKKAAGYATFNQRDMNLFLLASGSGYGVLVDNKTGKETFMRVGSLGGGVGMGLKELRVCFIFNDAKVMQQFVDSGWQFGAKADASAKYKDTGASVDQTAKANVDFKEGTVTSGGSSDARSGTDKGSSASTATATPGGPMEIYQFTESGVSLQATVAGTKYWKDSKLNQ